MNRGKMRERENEMRKRVEESGMEGIVIFHGKGGGGGDGRSSESA